MKQVRLGHGCANISPKILLEEEKLKTDQAIVDEDYVPQPFLDHSFDPHVWMHDLATIDHLSKHNFVMRRVMT